MPSHSERLCACTHALGLVGGMHGTWRALEHEENEGEKEAATPLEPAGRADVLQRQCFGHVCGTRQQAHNAGHEGGQPMGEQKLGAGRES